MTIQMSIFDTRQDNGDINEQGKEPNHTDSLETMLMSIKNDKGEPKYASVEEALKGLQHAQGFIDTLKTEKSQLEQEVAARKSVEDALKGLSTPQDSPVEPTGGLKPEDIKALVDQQLNSYKTATAESENVLKCETSLKAKYGDKAGEVLKTTAEKLGKSPEDLQKLAAKDPQLFLGLFTGELRRETNQNFGGLNSLGYQSSPESTVRRNSQSLWNGGNARDEFASSKKMVEELHAQGLDTYSLTDPKVYFKQFSK